MFHLLGWFFWFSLPIIHFKSMPFGVNGKPPALPMPGMEGADSFNQLQWMFFGENLLLVVIFYFNLYYFVPRVLFRKGLASYLLVVAGLTVLHLGYTIALHFHLLPQIPFPLVVSLKILSGLFILLLVGITFHLITEKIQKDRIVQENENERLRMELGFLRSQISPHFIFNVLNNVISLSRLQPALVEPTLLKLSGIMRYMLYEMKNEKVSLGNEITYLNHFIELQMQRFQDSVSVQKHFEGVNSNLMIEPLLLVPFIENAFKHGQIGCGNGSINLTMETEGNTLYFKAENKVGEDNSPDTKEPGGIGLANVARRLALLYDKRFELQTSRINDAFLVNLKIDLQ